MRDFLVMLCVLAGPVALIAVAKAGDRWIDRKLAARPPSEDLRLRHTLERDS